MAPGELTPDLCLRYEMQLQDQSKAALARGCDMTDMYQRLNMLQSHVSCVEDEMEEAHRALQDKGMLSAADVAEQVTTKCQAWTCLRQQNAGTYQHEMTSQRKATNLVQLQLQLRLDEAATQKLAGTEGDIECGRSEHSSQGIPYQGAVRLLPPILVIAFLTALATCFGADLLRHQTGLTMTQQVASIGSATLTVVAVIALLVRAVMCTAEWQWGLQVCHCMTGWSWFKPVVQHAQEQQTQQQIWAQHVASHVLEHLHKGVPHDIVEPAACDLSSTDNQSEEQEGSTDSFDHSDLEIVKKQS